MVDNLPVYKRHVETSLTAALADTPVVLINGARQTGKSTLAQQVVSARSCMRYLTLDDPTVLAAARDPVGFIRGLGESAVIDEVQKAPELFPAIKLEVDRNRRPGRFLLTGSANVMLLPRLSESLAGRMEILELWPLSQGEISGRREGFMDGAFAKRLPPLRAVSKDDPGLPSLITRGGYPEMIARASESRRRAWLSSYLQTMIQRDLRDLANIEGQTGLPRLLSLIAARSGGLLNTAELSRASGTPHTTLTRYLTLLQAAFLYTPLPAWSANLSKRLIKAPKLYLADTGLAAHLAGFNAQRLHDDPSSSGFLLETFVLGELRKQATWSENRVRLHHFRTAAGQEVDFVLEDAEGRIVGIEVKMKHSLGERDLVGLRTMADEIGKRFVRGILLCGTREVIPLREKFTAMPIDAVWQMGG